MKSTLRYYASGFLIALALSTRAGAQERSFTAEKICIDNGLGHSVTLQAPVGLLTPVTFTFPIIGGTLLTSATGFLNSITAGTGITVTNSLPTATISVSNSYTGGNAITTLGTISSGTWNAGSVTTSNAAGISASGGPISTGASGVAGALKIFPSAAGSPLSLTTTSNGGTYVLPSPATTAGYVLSNNGTGTLSWTAPGGSSLTGGTSNSLTKWTSSSTIGNSNIFDNGTTVQIGISGAGGVVGSLALANTGNSNLVKIQPATSSAAYTLSLPAVAPINTGDVLTYNSGSDSYSWSQAPSASVISIADDNSGVIATSSTTDATVTGTANYSFTPTVAGDYVVNFSTWVDGGVNLGISKNGTRIAGTARETAFFKTSEESAIATQAYLIALTTSDVITIVWKSTGGTSSMHDRNMIVQRVK